MIKKHILFVSLFLNLNFAIAQLPSQEDVELRKSALELVNSGKTKKALSTINKITNNSIKDYAYLGYIDGLFNIGQKDQAIEFAETFFSKLKKSDKNQDKKEYFSDLELYYSEILVNHDEYVKAYNLMNPILKNKKKIRYTIQETYIKALIGASKNEEAYALIQEAIISGKTTKYVLDTALKQVCTNLGDSETTYLKRRDSLNFVFKQKLVNELKNVVTNKVAPDFQIKDVNGNLVSLGDFKGKTVVLDFWANWCYPCKDIFPIMQQAQNHYKNDPNVVFLYIHTFEKDEVNPLPAAVKYLEDKHFDFKVLFDLKETGSKENAVAKSYNVSAIPTKFIIDSNGNIRFTSVGGVNYYHSELYTLNHLITMIDLVSNKEI